jgi:hypothetical protein
VGEDARRRHAVTVRLSGAEVARLDELRGNAPRANHLRRLLYEPPNATEVASREEVLALLSEKARSGSVSAAIALERAL